MQVDRFFCARCFGRFPQRIIVLFVCCAIAALSGCGTSPSSQTISDNGGGSTGTPPPQQHQVDLVWDAPVSSPAEVVGFNVYRSAQGSSSYQRLNSSLETETVYLDLGVKSGLSYNYYVTSVDGSGAESGPSNTVAATIP